MKVSFCYYAGRFSVVPSVVGCWGMTVLYPYRYAVAIGWGFWNLTFRWGTRE